MVIYAQNSYLGPITHSSSHLWTLYRAEAGASGGLGSRIATGTGGGREPTRRPRFPPRCCSKHSDARRFFPPARACPVIPSVLRVPLEALGDRFHIHCHEPEAEMI